MYYIIGITPAISAGQMATPSIRTDNDLNLDIELSLSGHKCVCIRGIDFININITDSSHKEIFWLKEENGHF